MLDASPWAELQQDRPCAKRRGAFEVPPAAKGAPTTLQITYELTEGAEHRDAPAARQGEHVTMKFVAFLNGFGRFLDQKNTNNKKNSRPRRAKGST